jgi:hypothetical protein
MKRPIFCRVYIIAEKYNVTQVMVHNIINSYIDYCKKQLYVGKEVQIFGLVTLVPDVVKDNYKTTLAYDCYQLAEQLGLPSHTVYVIIKEYINSLEEEILQGRNVEMRGLVALHPMTKDGVLSCIHSAISTTIKNELKTLNTPVSSVRVHTHKLLKYKLKESVAV